MKVWQIIQSLQNKIALWIITYLYWHHTRFKRTFIFFDIHQCIINIHASFFGFTKWCYRSIICILITFKSINFRTLKRKCFSFIIIFVPTMSNSFFYLRPHIKKLSIHSKCMCVPVTCFVIPKTKHALLSKIIINSYYLHNRRWQT